MNFIWLKNWTQHSSIILYPNGRPAHQIFVLSQKTDISRMHHATLTDFCLVSHDPRRHDGCSSCGRLWWPQWWPCTARHRLGVSRASTRKCCANSPCLVHADQRLAAKRPVDCRHVKPAICVIRNMWFESVDGLVLCLYLTQGGHLAGLHLFRLPCQPLDSKLGCEGNSIVTFSLYGAQQ